jgi:D-sedoheptulose 7-phosphate isomerase
MVSNDEVINRIFQICTLISDPRSFPSAKIDAFVNSLEDCFLKGNKIAFLGNGGSAAESLHLAAEFTGKCVIPHRPLPALSLNSNQSELTAIANDFGVQFMFSRLVEAHLKDGDILVCLSTSGKSQNIINAIHAAVQRSVKTYLWTGLNFEDMTTVEVWKVPSTSTPRIQEVHLMWGHIIAEVLEARFSKSEEVEK